MIPTVTATIKKRADVSTPTHFPKFHFSPPFYLLIPVRFHWRMNAKLIPFPLPYQSASSLISPLPISIHGT